MEVGFSHPVSQGKLGYAAQTVLQNRNSTTRCFLAPAIAKLRKLHLHTSLSAEDRKEACGRTDPRSSASITLSIPIHTPGVRSSRRATPSMEEGSTICLEVVKS